MHARQCRHWPLDPRTAARRSGGDPRAAAGHAGKRDAAPVGAHALRPDEGAGVNWSDFERALFRPRAQWWTVVAFLLIPAVGVADYFTGPEITFSVFYLVPVAVAAWISGAGAAIAGSVFASIVWLCAELASSRVDANLYIYGWNFAARLLFLLLVAMLLAQLRAMIARERELGRTDALTGLVNARGCREIAEAEIARAQREGRSFSMAFIDVDEFKRVNDTRGHAAGDALLKRVAEATRATLRASDVVARYGGDEFIVLLPLTDQAAARVVIGKIADKVGEATARDFGRTTLSIGVVTWAPGGTRATVDAVLLEADRLMYAVKTSGKAGARFTICGHEVPESRR
jgi:diguanylate cyclase (GGDEF)-like protein